MAMDLFQRTIVAMLLSFVVAYAIDYWLINGSKKWGQWGFDHPNARSLHVAPVSRLGGIGLFLGVLTSWSFFSLTLPNMVWIGLCLLLIVSVLDDIKGLPVWFRLCLHSFVALSCAFDLFFSGDGYFSVIIGAAAIVWMINLYNFMDGSDGLAGGMAVIGFGSYGLFAYWAGYENYALINFSIAAAALGFLIHNFSPARIFLGDGGAIPLGFLAIVVGVLGWKESIWPMWFPWLIFSPFIVDATVTLLKRVFRGEKIWQAHRQHYYQSMVQNGFGHRNTALCWYGVMLLAGISAVWAAQQDSSVQRVTLIGWSTIYLMLLFIFESTQKFRGNRG